MKTPFRILMSLALLTTVLACKTNGNANNSNRNNSEVSADTLATDTTTVAPNGR